MNTSRLHSWQYDKKADAAYLRLAEGRVVESEETAEGIVLDLDAGNRILGIEILRAAARLPSVVIAPAAE